MHTARTPPEDPAPATTAAVLAMHTGQIIDFVSYFWVSFIFRLTLDKRFRRSTLNRFHTFFLVGGSLAGRDQALQAATDVSAPSVGADIETLVGGDQALVREVYLRLIAFP